MPRYLLLILLSLISLTAASQSVYKTPSGKKYHLASCRMVENVSQKLTVEQATQSGLEPCKICKPDVEGMQGSNAQKEKGQSTTTRCSGITRAGSRCKHMTSIANGYCYQHQP